MKITHYKVKYMYFFVAGYLIIKSLSELSFNDSLLKQVSMFN